MLTHFIKNKNYYIASELTKSDPVFFKKSLKRVREIINNHKIPKASYLYCNRRSGDRWTPIEGKYPAAKDKLFISETWCGKHVPTLMEDQNVAMTLYDSRPLPPLCEVSDEELFCMDGYYYDVEVRGERTIKGCYFSAMDIAYILDMGEIKSSLCNSSYIEGIDYIKFMDNSLSTTQKMVTKYFFTYQGLLKYIFRSRSKSSYADLFIQWATETLFTLHIGTTEQKTELINNYIGTDFKLFKQVMLCHPGKISCVYLISLGSVKDLKETFSIEDERDANIVCKYGRTNNIDRRMTELSNEYKKKNSKVSLSVVTFSFIDDVYASEAEAELARIFSDGYNKLTDIKENELVCMNKRQISNTSKFYRLIESDYGKEYDKIKAKYVEKDAEKNNTIFEKNKIINEKEQIIMEKERIIMGKERTIIEQNNENEKQKLKMQSEIDKLNMQSEIDKLKSEAKINKLRYCLDTWENGHEYDYD
jgi:hypothetical protein